MSKLTITLSWPDSVLWPNRMAGWRAKIAANRAARGEAYVLTKNALDGREWQERYAVIVLTVTGHKPAERGQDRDNFNSALKSAYDGIASALGVNDRYFRYVVDWGDARPPKGGVTVEIT